VRLTKTPEQYAESRESRREISYEAMLASGRTAWSLGDRVRVYRTRAGSGGVVEETDEGGPGDTTADPRDYDVEHYVRLLRDTYASRLDRAFAPRDYEAVFADPSQMEMFAPEVAAIRPILSRLTSGT
jgi:DNA polymerase, archaea type